MVFIEFGMTMEAREWHPSNAQFPMLIIEFGRSIDVSEEQRQNALVQIIVYPSIMSEVITTTLSKPSSITTSLDNTDNAFSLFIIDVFTFKEFFVQLLFSLLLLLNRLHLFP